MRAALHWALAIAPFALVLALSLWGYGRYAWAPLAAAALCPLGVVLVGLRLAADRRAERGD
jgi:hypothetical protein